ncbi:hypothetical protein AN958_05141 [Leucoagaricus sp. SymC.cos]|nr:hypothetical protein AN958_05141 [Leucoagaricus sp. SymC.cos]
MTRTDFIEELVRLSIISIDINHDIRPDYVDFRGHSTSRWWRKIRRVVLSKEEDLSDWKIRMHEFSFQDLEEGDKIELPVYTDDLVPSFSFGTSSWFNEEDHAE